MNSDNLMFGSCIIAGIFGIVFLTCFVYYQEKQRDHLAIKQGLVQKVDQAKIVWVKP